MTDETETPDALEPHPFVACTERHLIPRDAHCAVPGCDRGPDDEIHKAARAA